jgi:hypothetical protein
MELNGGTEQGRIAPGNDKGLLQEESGIRIIAVLKADSGHRSGLYMEADAALTGTLSTLVTAVIRTGRARRSG